MELSKKHLYDIFEISLMSQFFKYFKMPLKSSHLLLLDNS